MHIAERNLDTPLADSLSRITVLLLDTAIDMAAKMNNLDYLRLGYGIRAEAEIYLNHHKEAMESFTNERLFYDSIFNEQKSQQIEEIQTKYETESRDAEIRQLNSENEIKQLKVIQQEEALRADVLTFDKKQNEILLLNQSQEIQKLQLTQSHHDLEHFQINVEDWKRRQQED
jgi:hypothetical protein